MPSLADRQCVPCKGGVPPLSSAQFEPLLAQLDGWAVVDDHHLQNLYKLKNFVQALELVNRIGAIAEEQNHHPDIFLAWGKVEVKIWTHKINGLTESDFIFAAKCDAARAVMADA
ncbi:MAG TPA: 4a-hydroxytetrahydrobiopterin dehydratase [Candidatus Acidoferrales bacterium]|nr:4a-hydroxytetrahydrobiopterin dehydratase [Candidatus Acidoferrales bacterium]